MPKTLEELTASELDAREKELLASMESTPEPMEPTPEPMEPNDLSQLGPAGLEIREHELVDRLRIDGVKVNEPEPVLSPEDSYERDKNIQVILKMPEMADTEPGQVIDNYSIYANNKIGFREALVRARKLELLPFVGSLYKAERFLSVLNAAQRLTEPDGTMTDDLSRPIYLGRESIGTPIRYSKVPVDNFREQDMKLVSAWIEELNEEQERGFSIGGRIAQGLAELPAFMIEFLMTGPIFKAGSTATKKAASKILGRYAEKGVGKYAVKLAGAGIGSLARTGVQMPRIMAGAAENMTKNIQITDDGSEIFLSAETTPFEALARSFADLYIENITEVSGDVLTGGAKTGITWTGGKLAKKYPVLQKFTAFLGDKWIANAPEGTVRTVSDFLTKSATKVGYHGIIGEMAEERLGGLLRSATGLQSWSEMIPSMEDMLVEAGIFSVPGAVNLAYNRTFRPGPYIDAPIEREVLPGTEIGQSIIAPIGEDGADFKAAKPAPTVEDLSKDIDWKGIAEQAQPPAAKEAGAEAGEGKVLDSIEKKAGNRPYVPITTEQINEAIKAGLVKKKAGKITLTDEGRNKLYEFRAKQEELQLEEGKTFDEGQEDLIQRIEKGEAVTQAEIDKFGLTDSSFAKKAILAPIEGKRVISEESYRKAKKNLTDPTKLRAGVGPQDLIDLVTVGAYHIENGAKTFAEFSKRMIREFGEKIRPSLQKLWESSKNMSVNLNANVDKKTRTIEAGETYASVEHSDFDALRRNVARASDVLGHWGSIGRKVQAALFDISRRSAVNTGRTTQNVKEILNGLSSGDRVTVAQLTDGAISEEGQPHRLTYRAKLLKEQLDKMQREAIAVGLRKKGLSGKAFPQILNEKGKKFLEEAETKGKKSHRVFAWAQNQVTLFEASGGKRGFETVDDAVAALQTFRKKRLRGTEGYLEGTRKITLPLDMREWNPDKVLPHVIEGGWENIEGARQWGVTAQGNFKSLRTDIERVREEVGKDQANMLENYIKAQYGQSSASFSARKWNKRARTFQFTTKLAPSPLTIIRNMLDRYAKGMTHSTIGTNIRATTKFPPFLNVWLDTSKKIQDEMIRHGAVLGHGHIAEGLSSGGGFTRLLSLPFASSEKGNQTYIALVKKLQIEADIKRLHEMGGETGTVGKVYDRMLNIVGKSQFQTTNRVLMNMSNDQLAESLSQGKISDDLMSEILHRTTTDSAFPLTLASKRMWWGNRPFLQTATQFKIWSADQMRFIYKDVLKYTIATGDPSRLARFMVGTWLAGEIYNIARDFLTDRDESLLSTVMDENGRNPKDISWSIAKSLIDGGVIGMLADLTYGISDWFMGPTVGSIESVVTSGFSAAVDPASAVDGLKKYLLSDVPAAKQAQGVLDKIDRTFFDKEDENLTENYAQWRTKSFEYRRKTGLPSEIERLGGDMLFGRTERVPGQRTLSHEMIARQVLVGDYDDAADYIKGLLRDAPIEKVKDVMTGLTTSMNSRSPFGSIAKKDIPLFLSPMTVKKQAEGIKLQMQWIKGYEKATEIAISGLKDEGFEKELEGKLADYKKEVQPQIDKFISTYKELEQLLKEK